MKNLREEAIAMIESGCSPDDLAHVIYFGDDESMLSSPLPAGSDLAGYAARYYTLAEWAGAAS